MGYITLLIYLIIFCAVQTMQKIFSSFQSFQPYYQFNIQPLVKSAKTISPTRVHLWRLKAQRNEKSSWASPSLSPLLMASLPRRVISNWAFAPVSWLAWSSEMLALWGIFFFPQSNPLLRLRFRDWEREIINCWKWIAKKKKDNKNGYGGNFRLHSFIPIG